MHHLEPIVKALKEKRRRYMTSALQGLASLGSQGVYTGLSAANYYADSCLACGKKLEMQPDGRHEDEWDRGYCQNCSAHRQVNAVNRMNALSPTSGFGPPQPYWDALNKAIG